MWSSVRKLLGLDLPAPAGPSGTQPSTYLGEWHAFRQYFTDVGPAARDRWLVHMRAAVVAENPPSEVAEQLFRYFDMAAEAMRNRE